VSWFGLVTMALFLIAIALGFSKETVIVVTCVSLFLPFVVLALRARSEGRGVDLSDERSAG